jgi:hypothetical protein
MQAMVMDQRRDEGDHGVRGDGDQHDPDPAPSILPQREDRQDEARGESGPRNPADSCVWMVHAK